MCVKNFNSLAWFSTLLFASLSLGGCANLPAWMLLQRKAAVTDFQHFDNASVQRPEKAWDLPLDADDENQLRLPVMPNGEAFAATLERTGTSAFVVIRHGKVVMEWYFNGTAREALLPSFSVAKSIVATLLGIALSEGKITSLDDPITRYLPELAQSDARFVRVTLRQLLEMRSGIDFEEEYETPWDDGAALYLTEDLAAEVGKMTIERNPDEVFH